MDYKASLSYRVNYPTLRARDDVPVSYFYVLGGASRIINLNVTEDRSITAELDEARQYRNIVVFTPLSIEAIWGSIYGDLMYFADQEFEHVFFETRVEKYLDGKMLERHELFGRCRVKHPVFTSDQTCKVVINFRNTPLIDVERR